jgi:hypothetical protein
MNPSELHHALMRLHHAPWRSRTTDEATRLIEQNPTEADLIQALAAPRSTPTALEALAAWEADSEPVFEAVQHAIQANPAISWAFIETLNRLPWYGGVRAFLSLPDPPQTSPCAYSFYMLARNKLFQPSDMPHAFYCHCYGGLWLMLPAAKANEWHNPDPAVLSVVDLMYNHLEGSQPDPFVVFFSSLLLGSIAPLRTNLRSLQIRAQADVNSRVRITAGLALGHLLAIYPWRPQSGPDITTD